MGHRQRKSYWVTRVQQPHVSVVIPHYNDLKRLDLCLDALSRQSLPAEQFEIIVADNGSPAGEAAVADAIAGRARLVTALEKGAGPARNAGVAASRTPLLAFTDSDCVPEPGWLAAGIAMLDQADLVGGRMTVATGTDAPLSGAEAFESVFAFDNRNYVEKKGFTVTANLFCSRAVFDKVGPFRVRVAEDMEWCQRAGNMGLRLAYAEAAVVAHPARRDWAELKRKWKRTNAERFDLAASRPLGRLRWLGQSLLMPASILVHAPRIITSPALSGIQPRLSALGTLARLRLWRSIDSIALMLRGG